MGLAGFGTVGGGLARLLEENAGIIRQRTGRDIQVKKVLVRNAQKARTVPLPPGADLTTNPDELINDPEIDVLVELMGGIDAPRTIIDRALDAGKHIVTANKALLAEEGLALFQKAAGKGRILRYEASVAGAVPVVEALRTSLAGNRISSLMGILNGTTNYILTQMIHNGVTFEDALRQAQVNGYAEKDPTADIEGHDACRKICILSDLAYGDKFDPDQVSCEGITKITLEDVANADKLGCVIKLLGRSVRCEDGTAYAYVAPHLIHKESPLAAVEDVFNAIMIDGNATGEVMFYGKGAGKLATASAVVADMLDSIEHKDNRRRIFWGDGSKNLLRPLDTLQSAWYVRFKGAQKDVEELLPVESLTEPAEGVFVVQTRKLSTAEMNAAAEKLNGRGEVRAAMRIL